jgi:hypothetical protein
MNPFTAAAFAWQAGLVFTLRSARMWAEPAKAQAQLTAFALEKQRAFTQGALAAQRATLAGGSGAAVLAAALAPAHRRVRANARKLTKL